MSTLRAPCDGRPPQSAICHVSFATCRPQVVVDWSRGEVRRIQERKLDAVVKLLAEQQQEGQQQQQQVQGGQGSQSATRDAVRSFR